MTMNETMKTLLGRRSVRAYLPRPVEPEKLDEILQAGLYAPSAMGRQSVTIVLVQDAETLAQLRSLNAQIMGKPDADPFYGAPAAAVVLTDTALAGEENGRCDGALAMGNLMNAAASVGVSSCWINRMKETFERPEGRALLRAWGLPETMMGVGACILGYAAAPAPAPAARREGRLLRV